MPNLMLQPAAPIDGEPIILLDLVATLVENHRACWHVKPLAARMAKERYRQWLVELMCAHYVIIITARKDALRDATLANIATKTGWAPQNAYFNTLGLEPHEFKARALAESIWPRYGQDRRGGYFAIESNERTRRMYAAHGVPAMPIPKHGVWKVVPFPLTQMKLALPGEDMDTQPVLALSPREATPDELIVLLDLNYTLVANQKATRHLRPFSKRMLHEAYRKWLIDLVRERFTILVTARPVHQMAASLANIQQKTGWSPQDAYFADRPYGEERPAQFKERILHEFIWPKYGQDRPYFAPESNPRTRAMYTKHGIPARPVPEDGSVWRALPVETGR